MLLKSLLDAEAVCAAETSKPVFFGLALGGEEGVARVLSLLKKELEADMALCGCRDVAHVTRSAHHRPSTPSP